MGYYYCFARAEDELWAFGEGQDWTVTVGPQVVGGLDDHSQVLAEIAKEGAVEGLAGEAIVEHFTYNSEMLGLLSKINADMLKLLFHANRIRAKAHVAWENLPPAEPTQSMLDKFVDIFDPADRAARARQEADTKRQAAAAAKLGELREELNEIGIQILDKAGDVPLWDDRSDPVWVDHRKEPGSVMSFPRPEQTALRLPGGQGEGSQTWSAPLPSTPVPALGHPGSGPASGAADGGTAGAGTLPGVGGVGGGMLPGTGAGGAGSALTAGAMGGAALAGGRMLAGQAGVGAGGVGGPGSLGGASGASGGGAPARVPGQGLRGAFGTAGAGGLPAGGAGVPGAGGAPVGGMVGGAPGAGQQPARRPGEGLRGWGGHIVPKWEDDPDWEPLPPEFLGSDENDL
ncbi:MAG: hypothetical protein FWD18_07665 [Micrococcales bacterium]|nr:hypothetical protein [Micrococcales bacterium]